MLLLKSPAKVNLHLRILGKRTDGYHEIVTLFHTIGLYDEMIFHPTKRGLYLKSSGYPLPENKDNLVYRAASLLIEKYPPSQGANITLRKRIPVAAGLGGGSSNAATTLVALNRLWNLNLDQAELCNIAMTLGSDVPFFLSGPAAVGRGRGEKLSPMEPLGGIPVVLVVPHFQVTSAWAYSNLNLRLTRDADDINLIQIIIRTKKIGEWAPLLCNDLEHGVVRKYPVIEQIKRELTAKGAEVALMSGSGPSVFGLFKEKKIAKEVADSLQGPGKTVILTETVSGLG